MSEQTSRTKFLVRAVVVAAFIAMLGLAGVQRVEANQSGDTEADNVAFQKAICKLAGGTATVDTSRTVGEGHIGTTVKCKGGLLDGMSCGNQPGIGTDCYFPRVVDPVDHDFEQVDAIDEAPLDSDQTLDSTEIVAAPDTVEDVVATEPETVEESADPGESEDPLVEQPEIVDPEISEDPGVDPAPTADESADPEDVDEPLVQEIEPVDVPAEPIVEEPTWEYEEAPVIE